MRLAVKVAAAPSATDTKPPFSFIADAEAPLEIAIYPPRSTTAETAVAPDETYPYPPESIVVALAVPSE